MDSKKVDVITKEIMSVCLRGGFNEEAVLKIAEANTEETIFNVKGIIAALHFMIRFISIKIYLFSFYHRHNLSMWRWLIIPIFLNYSIVTCRFDSNAAKYDVDEISLSTEIQQLGLPKDNADIITNAFRDSKDKLREIQASESYRVSKLIDASWRVDQILASSNPEIGRLSFHFSMIDWLIHIRHRSYLLPFHSIEPECITAHIKLVVDNKPHLRESNESEGIPSAIENIVFEASEDKLDLLVQELSQASKILDNLDKWTV